MRIYIPHILSLFLLSVLILPFNNCGYTNTPVLAFEANSSSSANRMKITIESENPKPIAQNVQNFTITGTCAKGGHPNSKIYWYLRDMQGHLVGDSIQAASVQYLSTCENNNFSIEVRVPCPGAVNNNSGCYGLVGDLQLSLRMNAADKDAIEQQEYFTFSNVITLTPAP